jgi:uncharacterized protein (TIGR02246 family)
MGHSRLLTVLGVTFQIYVSGWAQTAPKFVIQDLPQNIHFAVGNLGEMPVGWQLGSSPASVNSARIVAGPVCFSTGRCAQVQSSGSEKGLSYLNQTIDATPYRGKRLTYRAAVRAQVTGASVVRLQVHTHHPDGTTSGRDAMGNHPITSPSWTYYEIEAPIASDARDIMFGVQVIGEGSAWIDNISLASQDATYSPSDVAVRALITHFADSRNAHDGASAAATYAEDGEYIGIPGTAIVKGRQALTTLWGGIPGRANRRIQSVDFPAPNIAVAHVATEFADDSGSVSQICDEAFIVVKDNAGWTIKVHQGTNYRAPLLLNKNRTLFRSPR